MAYKIYRLNQEVKCGEYMKQELKTDNKKWNKRLYILGNISSPMLKTSKNSWNSKAQRAVWSHIWTNKEMGTALVVALWTITSHITITRSKVWAVIIHDNRGFEMERVEKIGASRYWSNIFIKLDWNYSFAHNLETERQKKIMGRV